MSPQSGRRSLDGSPGRDGRDGFGGPDKLPGSAPGAETRGTALATCRGLVKRYGRVRALDGLDLTLVAGAPIALVGPNGAGKTTLMSVLAGFSRPSGGAVDVLGARPGSAALAGRLAALPQDALFDPALSIGHQLRVLAQLQGFDRRAARGEVDRVLAAVGLDDVAARRPTALSHGMRKRVALAQALLGKPALVLLDEPTAGIDPENARAIRELIAARETTYLVSSHNLDELERLCGSVIQLEHGRLVRHERLGAGGSTAPSAAAAPDGDELTLRLNDVPADAFAAAAVALDIVRSARQLPDGDWRLEVDDATRAAADLLALLAAHGWAWRHVGRGRSLEERLYGR